MKKIFAPMLMSLMITSSAQNFDLPVTYTKCLQYDIVGPHIQNYDFMINQLTSRGMQWMASAEC